MDVSLGLMIEGISLAKSIADLFGILETIDSKVDRLIESELKTGMLELQQAAISDTESTELLRSARQRFNKAITLEKGYKLCLSYVGVAICHFYLKDYTNTKTALENAISIKADISTKGWILAVLNDSYNPVSVFSPKKIKRDLRDTFKFRKNIMRSIGMFKKEDSIGTSTEKIIEDQKRLITLQEVAKVELDAMNRKSS